MSAVTASPEAERAVIAALIRNPDASEIMRLGISRDLFTLDTTAEAFGAIVDLLVDNVRPDAATLQAALDGAAAIEVETSLLAHASPANLAAHVGILKDCRKDRAEKESMQQLQAAIKRGCTLDELRNLINEQAERLPQKRERQQTRFTAAELLKKEFPDPVWLLPDILPETGLYLLCGKPKSGKSWMALGMAMALAQGGRYLARSTPQRKVCYLALEDTPRRLKNRLEKLLVGGIPDDLDGLDLRTAAPKLGSGLDREIRQAAADGFKVVIIDTLQKIRPPAAKHGTQYGDDYAVLGEIKDIADECGICIVVIHHLRKAESADDPFDDVSGTNGVMGSADGALILRRIHGKPEATLYITGRDMPDAEFGVRFDNGLWQFAGTAAEVRATAEQSEILDSLSHYSSEGATIKMLCSDTGKQRRNIDKLLRKLADSGLVRVRRAKPANFFAVCDGPMGGITTESVPPIESAGTDARSTPRTLIPPSVSRPMASPVPGVQTGR